MDICDLFMVKCSPKWNSYEYMHMPDITYATHVGVSVKIFSSQYEVNKSLSSSSSESFKTSWHLRWDLCASLLPVPLSHHSSCISLPPQALPLPCNPPPHLTHHLYPQSHSFLYVSEHCLRSSVLSLISQRAPAAAGVQQRF